MNPDLKTVCLSSIHQLRWLVVRYHDNGSPFSASWDSQPGHLPFPPPPGLILKRCSWPQCSQPHQQTLSLPESRKAAGRQAEEILPATALHWNSSHASQVNAGETRKDALHLPFFRHTGIWGREGVWLVSLPYTKEGRAGMSSWKDQKIAADRVRLRGRMRKSSLWQ